jgi:hypothetical protein
MILQGTVRGTEESHKLHKRGATPRPATIFVPSPWAITPERERSTSEPGSVSGRHVCAVGDGRESRTMHTNSLPRHFGASGALLFLPLDGAVRQAARLLGNLCRLAPPSDSSSGISFSSFCDAGAEAEHAVAIPVDGEQTESTMHLSCTGIAFPFHHLTLFRNRTNGTAWDLWRCT